MNTNIDFIVRLLSDMSFVTVLAGPFIAPGHKWCAAINTSTYEMKKKLVKPNGVELFDLFL